MKFYLKKSPTDSHLIMGKLYDAQFVPEGRFVYSTGERIPPTAWKDGRPKKGHEALQIRLNKISSAAAEYIRLNRESLTREGLKAYLDTLRPAVKKQAPPDAPKSLLQHWREYLDAIRGGRPGMKTMRNYDNSCNTFEAFLALNRWDAIPPHKFTITHLKRFESFLNQKRKDKKGNEIPPFKPNQQAKTLKHFKACLKHLVKLHEAIGFDIDEVKYKEKPGLKISLSEAELQGFIDAELTGSDDNVRDLFVLQCSLGPRVSDLQRLDKNIHGNKIVLETQKTEKLIELPITPQVRTILEKHNNQLPRLSEQNYRQGIKRIYKKLYPKNEIQVREGNTFKTVPVHEEISSHDAVRTFITLSAERGMSVNSIAKLTGKTVKVLIENYLVESQKVAEQEMEKAWGASPLKVAR
jgi:hypothetical protein